MLQGKESWLTNLQHLIASRLKCTSFADTSRSYPLCDAPFPIANSQYIIDGIVWGLNDYTEFFPESWMIIRNHVKECVETFHETSASVANLGDKPSTAQWRETSYAVSAAPQNLYVAWCLVDAVVKNEFFCERTNSLNIVLSAFPSLVGEYYPLFWMSRNALTDSAMEEYRSLFLNLLRSWWLLFPPTVNRRIGDTIAFRGKQVLEQLRESEGNANAESFKGSLDVILGVRGETESGYSSGGSSVSRNQTFTDHQVKAFVDSIFIKSYLRCPQCGVFSTSAEEKNAHYRSHFDQRNLDRDEKYVRLLYPTLDEFTKHTQPDRANYVKTIDTFEDSYRQGKRGATKVHIPEKE
ncbi:hypothetical protein AGDE_10061 [Angomonas deanei]|nr:hypothetical protein AGDE_10061 [Angomonas deanei]|eukprot:EPY29228.1 hypothetical protein AGDE_10061 [Angomonas deanei]